MTRAELIEYANAALRLGDWFIPPMGSIVLVDRNKRARARQYGKNQLGLYFIARTIGTSTPVPHFLGEGAPFSLWRLPRYYKDFELWPRPSNMALMAGLWGVGHVAR